MFVAKSSPTGLAEASHSGLFFTSTRHFEGARCGQPSARPVGQSTEWEPPETALSERHSPLTPLIDSPLVARMYIA